MSETQAKIYEKWKFADKVIQRSSTQCCYFFVVTVVVLFCLVDRDVTQTINR